MLVHARVDVEGRHLQVGRGESEPSKRIDQRKGLSRLLGIVVVAVSLVREIESRANDCDTVHAAGRECLFAHDRLERDVDAVVGEDRRIR